MNTTRLARYGAAAAATLAAANASGAVVYSGPLNTQIAVGATLSLDFDGNGVNDLVLKNYNFGGGSYQGATAPFVGDNIVSFRAGPNNYAYVTNLAAGTTVGSASAFTTFFGSMAYGLNNPNAQFNTANPGYVGFEFVKNGTGPYFGWARVNINNSAGTFTLVDWAYQNTVGTSIVTGVVPEPSAEATLGFLAAGAAGVALYRRRRTAQTSVSA